MRWLRVVEFEEVVSNQQGGALFTDCTESVLGGNPIYVVRVLSLLQVGGPHLFGPAGATLVKLTGSTPIATMIGLAIVGGWLVVPVVLSMHVFRRQDL